MEKRVNIQVISTKDKDVLIDLSTTNEPYLEFVLDLRAAGFAKWYYLLQLTDVSLAGINPYDTRLGTDTMRRILTESKSNVWYYIREVAQINPLDFYDGMGEFLCYKKDPLNAFLDNAFRYLKSVSGVPKNKK